MTILDVSDHLFLTLITFNFFVMMEIKITKF